MHPTTSSRAVGPRSGCSHAVKRLSRKGTRVTGCPSLPHSRAANAAGGVPAARRGTDCERRTEGRRDV